MSKGGSLRRSLWLLPLRLSWLVVASLVLQPLGWSAANAANQVERLPSQATSASAASATRVRVSDAYGKLPLSFEANRGQTDPQVKFLSRGGRHILFLTPTEAVLVLTTSKETAKDEFLRMSRGPGRPEEGTRTVLRMTFTGANPTPRVTGLEALPGKANYFIGNDPEKWQTNVPTYAKVRYDDLYPGIDLVYYGNQRQLEYDFVVRPGADPSRIVLGFQGADRLEVDPQGDLVLHTAAGQIRQRKPVIYQEVDGVRREIPGGYVVKGPQEVGFQGGAYDRSRPLVIDPVLVYSTYLGGDGVDHGHGIAVDTSGNAYVTGETLSANFPTTPGAFDTVGGGFGSGDAFVTKLNPAGSALVYSTYLGGRNGGDRGSGIAIDTLGHAYVTGSTGSSDFPTTPGAFDTTYGGGGTIAFVTKLNPAGSALVYSTYLGGGNFDQGLGIAVDTPGNAYVTGLTRSAAFPTTPGAFDTTLSPNIETDAFVTKLNPTGSALVYSTFLGGLFRDVGFAIAVDASGHAYVTGHSQSFFFEGSSENFPTTAGAFDRNCGGDSGGDVFVTKLNTTGSALVYSTCLGGSDQDEGRGVAVDASGHAYVTGLTFSANFPTTPGAFDTTFGGGTRDAFVTKLNATGSGLVYSTFLGGSGSDQGLGIALDALGQIYVTGETQSANFPFTADAFDTTLNGTSDAFVTKVYPGGTGADELVYSTYLGGSGTDLGRGVAVDASGDAYVTGSTGSSDFPTTPGAFDTTFGGGGAQDAFVVKITEIAPPATLTLTPAADTNPVATQHCVTATVQDASGDPTPDVTVRFRVTGAVTATGSATTDANGQATFCYPGPKAPGADTITAYADTDTDNVHDAGEPSGAATKAWVPGPPATVILTPAADTNPVATQHCVTATVQDAFGNPTSGVKVRFSVTGSVTTTGSETTGEDGQATFCYTGPSLPGADAITAFADTNNDGTEDGNEPAGAATKTWVLPVTTPGCEIIIDNGRITAANGDAATFHGTARSSATGQTSGKQRYEDKGPVQPLKVESINVQAVVCVPTTQADIYGEATIDGLGSFFYRISVKDLGEPGKGRDTYWILLQTGYSSGERTLEGGNVQIRRR